MKSGKKGWAVRTLCSILEIVGVGKTDILNAIKLGLSDFEDSLAAQCAKQVKAEYIVTRDISEFANSPVPVKEPADFLKQLK